MYIRRVPRESLKDRSIITGRSRDLRRSEIGRTVIVCRIITPYWNSRVTFENISRSRLRDSARFERERSSKDKRREITRSRQIKERRRRLRLLDIPARRDNRDKKDEKEVNERKKERKKKRVKMKPEGPVCARKSLESRSSPGQVLVRSDYHKKSAKNCRNFEL